MTGTEQMKRCLKCRMLLPVDQFTSSSDVTCKTCKELCIECRVAPRIATNEPRCRECNTKKVIAYKQDKLMEQTYLQTLKSIKASAKRCERCNSPVASKTQKYCRGCRRKVRVERGVENRIKHNAENCCKTLKEHHEKMKDDPDRLSTEFLKSILQCSCKVEIR